jgi:drug/metabolite transporter (DMT)-like permease
MIIEIGIIFAFMAMICWGFGDFFIQRCTRKIGDVESLAYLGIISIIVLIPLLMNDFPLLFNYKNLIILSVLGIITFEAAMLNFEALKEGKLSVVDVILEIELPVTAIFGVVFLGETLKFMQIVFMFIIFMGIVLIASKSLKGLKVKIERGVILAVLGSIVMGLVNFVTGISARDISPVLAIWFPAIIFSLISLVFIIKRDGFKKFAENGARFKWIIIAMGLFDTAAWVFYAFAMLKEEISIITAITESYPALGMVMGTVFNKEKVRWYQYAGGIIALAASIFLGLSV